MIIYISLYAAFVTGEVIIPYCEHVPFKVPTPIPQAVAGGKDVDG